MRHLLCAAIVLVGATAAAQTPPLKTPEASPEARLIQTVGLTEIEVSYHRPAVNGRPVWGQLVPYGEVWRAGANENTIVRLSTDAKIAGKPLRAGTYGLHMIPTAKDWTIVFSNVSSAWGSFTYDAKEDALRVTVTPRKVERLEERLAYRFDDPGDKTTTLVLSWEKLEVPVPIEVDTPKIVMASMRAELRGLPNFFWQPWNQAAAYWMNNGGSLDEAMKYVDKSIQLTPAFANTMTKATLLEKKGDMKGAGELRAKALATASEAEVNQYGYALIGQKKLDAAIEVFRKNVQAHPESWNVHDSLGEALLAKGDKTGAEAAYRKALSLVKDDAQKKRIERTLLQLPARSER